MNFWHKPDEWGPRWTRVGPDEKWDMQYLFQVRAGKLHGIYTEWFSNGQKLAEGTFTDGCQDGAWTHWRVNGQKLAEGTYKKNPIVECESLLDALSEYHMQQLVDYLNPGGC